MKIQQICPSCFSTRVHNKIGASGGYTENGMYRIPDDFGEVFSCSDCRFQGVGILEGNENLVAFLRDKKLGARMAKEVVVEKSVKESKTLAMLQAQLA